MKLMRLACTFVYLASGLATLLFGAGSCTVYTPMQPIMPLVAAVGQAEASANTQLNGRVEATAAYSPAPHLLLTAGGTACPKLGTNTFLVTRQYELGVGGYLPLGPRWLLSGLGGYGQAVSNRGYYDLGFNFGLSTHREYNARYSKLFLQGGIAHVQPKDTYGFTYRLTQVNFTSLTDIQLGELPLSQMLRHEASFFLRNALGSSGRWESQITLGISISSTPKQDVSKNHSGYGMAEYRANTVLLPTIYASAGVVYHPFWSGR